MASSSTTIPAKKRATIDDLYGVEGKAELIGGEVVHFMGSGYLPTIVACNIYIALRVLAKSHGAFACADGLIFSVPELPSGRESFTPDAAYYRGLLPTNRMRAIEGPPTFAVEVRSENDYGRAAEREMELKRQDYFAAGTLCVWDVDPLAKTVSTYRADGTSTVYGLGAIAEAEPAVPGWTLAVEEVFAE
ncbi:MAG: Uma2 family endonuclease [Gemmataceae bacterium]